MVEAQATNGWRPAPGAVVADPPVAPVEVVALGMGPLPAGVAGTAAVRAPAGDDPEELHAVVAEVLEAGRVALALYPSWAAARWSRPLATLRSSMESLDVLAVAVDLPPLGAAVAAGVVAEVAGRADAGTTAAAVGDVVGAVTSAAWLASVARLDHVEVGLGAHLRSWLPRSAFAVAPGREPAVVSASRRAPRLDLPEPADGLALVAAAGPRGERDVVASALDAAGWPPPRWVEPPEGSRAWWGGDRFVEVVAHPCGDATGELVWGLPAGVPCRWCGRRVVAGPCVFCRDAMPLGDRS